MTDSAAIPASAKLAMADAPTSPTSVTGDAEPDAKDEDPPPITLPTLPPELLEAVWMKLPASAVLHICATCRGFRATARSDIVWRSLLARDLLPPGFGAASAVLRRRLGTHVAAYRLLHANRRALLLRAGPLTPRADLGARVGTCDLSGGAAALFRLTFAAPHAGSFMGSIIMTGGAPLRGHSKQPALFVVPDTTRLTVHESWSPQLSALLTRSGPSLACGVPHSVLLAGWCSGDGLWRARLAVVREDTGETVLDETAAAEAPPRALENSMRAVYAMQRSGAREVHVGASRASPVYIGFDLDEARDYFGVGGAGRSAEEAEIDLLCVHGLGNASQMRLLAAHAEAFHPRLVRLVDSISYCEVASPHPPPKLGIDPKKWPVPAAQLAQLGIN